MKKSYISLFIFYTLLLFCGMSSFSPPLGAQSEITAPTNVPMVSPQSQEPPTSQKLDRRKLLVPQRNADGSIIETPFSEAPLLWLRDKTRKYYSALGKAMRDIKNGGTGAATSLLILLSFLYGIFHAAGPGHGKIVLTSWLLATHSDLKKGLLISALSSLIQALSAITLVSIPLLLFANAAKMARQFAGWMEVLSFGLIVVVGFYLFNTGLKQLRLYYSARKKSVNKNSSSMQFKFKLDRPPPPPQHTSTATAHLNIPQLTLQRELENNHSTDYLENHAPTAPCPHCSGHTVAPEQLRQEFSWRHILGLALSVGLRPCTGAIAMLLLAYTLGLYWAGILASFAMSFGTFLTVSCLAALAVYSRNLAGKLAHTNQNWMMALNIGLRLLGGLFIMAIGLVFIFGVGSMTGQMN